MPPTVAADSDVDISYGPSGYKGLFQNKTLVGLSAFASIGGVLFGYDQGVISGVLVMNNFMKQFPSLANNTTLQGWMVSILVLAAMFGALLNGPISDRYSRRWSILLATIIFNVGSVIQAAAMNLAMIFIGRAIAGFSIGQLSMVVPLYISECSPPNLRGSLVSFQQWGITVGILVSFWLDYGAVHIGGDGDGQSPAAWRLPLALQCVPALVLGVGTAFLPYSPRWLMLQGREQEAASTLARIRRVRIDDWRLKCEILEIQAVAIFEEELLAEKFPGEPSKWRVFFSQYAELFTTDHLRRRLVIACLLQIIQQFTGINAIIYFAPTIFKNIGLTGNSINLLATGVVGVINFLSTIPAIMYLDRWGRRTVLIIGAIGMSIAQLIVGTLYAKYDRTWDDHVAAGWTCAVFIWVYISFFAFSIGCVNWLMPSEMFPPAHRGKAVGLAIGTNWLSNFIIALVTPRMLEKIRFGTFYFFLAFCVILLVWVYFFVPETKGLRMEEMDKLFGGNQGFEQLNRISSIRVRLGLDVAPEENVKLGSLGQVVHDEDVKDKIAVLAKEG